MRVAATVLAWAALFLAGCTLPCEQNADCPNDMHCGAEGVCDQQCTSASDCGLGEFCDRGACLLDARPQVQWLSPEEGADVGERTSVEVEVRFRAAEVVVELTRDPSNGGEPCAPLIPRRVVVDGDFGQEVVRTVRFEDVPSLGGAFGLQVRAFAPSTEAAVVRRAFTGSLDASIGGIEVSEPRSAFVDADVSLTTPITAALSSAARSVAAWVEPAQGPRTPRRVIAQDSATLTGRAPLARGPQVLWLEADVSGVVRRCGVGLNTEPTANGPGIEIGLAFAGPEATNLDLWIYADLDDEGQSRCAADPPSGVCARAWSQPGLRRTGEEAVILPALEGIYGVAVAPAAATAPVSAFVRVSNQNVHLGFFGPRSVLADEAQVWLAGRVLVLGGTVALEPLDRVTLGLPVAPASAW